MYKSIVVSYPATIPSTPEGHAFTHAVKSRAERRYRSAEGRSEAQRAKRPNIAFVFAVVLALAFIFRVFSPKIACQVPKPLIPLPCNDIRAAC